MKIIKILLTLVLLVGCSTSKTSYAEKENEKFNEFLKKEFIENMESDYVSLHYNLKDYEVYGIKKPEPVFSEVSFEEYDEMVLDAKESLKELNSFKLNELSKKQAIDYRIYEKYLKDYIEINSYPMFDNYFDPNRGITNNLITIFSEFEFRSKEDFDDYLTLLESVPSFIDSALEFTKKQASEGYFMTDEAVGYVVESIVRFTSKVNDNELIVDFNNEIKKFDLDANLKNEYIKRNESLIINEIIPSYLKVQTELESLKGSRKHEGGIYNFENGKEYYNALIKSKSSNSKDLTEQLKQIEKGIMDEFSYLANLAQTNPEVFDSDFSSVKFSDAESIIKFNIENMSKHYPKGPDVNYEISYLDPTVANESTLAYYLTPTIDDISRNVIKVNPNSGQENIKLYTTVSHEGFPGHLYQITYFLNTNPNPIRSVVSHIGYTEGWAMYTETRATYDLDLTEGEAFVYNLDIKLNYYLSAAVDIGVNGLGWTLDDTIEWLSKYKFEDFAEGLYEQALMFPTMLVPYGMGLLQMDNLRSYVEHKLSDKFDEIEFNKILLDNGDRPFELVKEDIDEYISSKK